MNISDHLCIGWHLLRREVHVLMQSWRSKFTSLLIPTGLFYLSFGYFLPAMGMPPELILPAFIGGVVSLSFVAAEETALSLSFDLKQTRLIAYHCALPLSVSLVLGVYVVGIVLRTISIIVPILFAGSLLLSGGESLCMSPFFLTGILLATFVFFALMFLCLALTLSTESLMGNMWPRFMVPLLVFGCNFYPLRSVHMYAPRLASFMACNPLTLSTEGVRAAFLGRTGYLNVWWCLLGLLMYAAIASIVCWYAVRTRLAPVSMVQRKIHE